MIAEQKIASMGIELPAMSEPKAMYVPVVQTGNLCFVSGQIPMVGDSLVYTGKVGDTRTLEEAQSAAKICVINALAALKAHLGDLDRITRFIKVQAFVASKVGFDQQHIVVNAASQLLFDSLVKPGGMHAQRLPLTSFPWMRP